ncbi:hypothetical protein ACXNSR_19130 [Streptomyces sp. NC-S4]
MARELTGTGRVTLFPLLHMWEPQVWGVAAYTSYGHFGTVAIVGYIPIPEAPDIHFTDVAARHIPSNAAASQRTDWILCTAWSARTVPKSGSLEVEDAEWVLESEGRSVPHGNGGNMYGHSELHIGRLALKDEVLMKQARELLPTTTGWSRP